jgi:hypothetical protein
MIAQMLRAKGTLKDGSKKSLWDLYELDDNDNLTFRQDLLQDDTDFTSKADIHSFFNKVIKVNQKVHGDYHNPMMIKKGVVGRVFMLFRTWLPMAVKERFGGEYHDADLGVQKGRFVSLWNVMSNLKDGGWKDAGKVLLQLIPIIGKKAKLSDQVSEIDRENIAMAVREIQFLLMLTMAVITLKAALDDEEDEENKSILRYLYNQMERSQSELMFFFVPTDTMQIVRDVIPLYSTLRDATRVIMRATPYFTGSEEDLYQRGFRKGDSKFVTAVEELVPISRAYQKAWSAASQTFSDSRYR